MRRHCPHSRRRQGAAALGLRPSHAAHSVSTKTVRSTEMRSWARHHWSHRPSARRIQGRHQDPPTSPTRPETSRDPLSYFRSLGYNLFLLDGRDGI